MGLDNYIRAFGDRNFLNSFFVTTNFTLLSVFLSVVIGLAIALLLQRKSKLNTFTKTLLIFPFAISPALKGYSFRFMLNDTYGCLTRFLTPCFAPWAFLFRLVGSSNTLFFRLDGSRTVSTLFLKSAFPSPQKPSGLGKIIGRCSGLP